MITFSQLGKYGAIGNQLFQYATLYSIGKANNYIVKIPNTEEYFDDGTKRIQHYFLNCFDKIEAKLLDPDDFKNIKYKINWGFPAIFNEKLFKIPDDSDLEGYFQSYKFFDSFKKEIISQLEFKDSIKESITKKYNFNINEFSSVHLRCGDYVGRDHHHPIMNEEYYRKAFEIVNTDKYLVFSDTISKAKEIFNRFKDIDFIYIENNHCFEDLFLMSSCRNNIIANSSFSWWATYMNKNNPIVVAPRNWLGPAYNRQWNIDDLLPKHWNIV